LAGNDLLMSRKPDRAIAGDERLGQVWIDRRDRRKRSESRRGPPPRRRGRAGRRGAGFA